MKKYYHLFFSLLDYLDDVSILKANLHPTLPKLSCQSKKLSCIPRISKQLCFHTIYRACNLSFSLTKLSSKTRLIDPPGLTTGQVLPLEILSRTFKGALSQISEGIMTLVASDIVQRFNGNAVLGLDRLPIAREFCKGTGLGGAKVGVGGGQADGESFC
ncbi:hypothetical protein AMTRI_Chr05g61350 [Amborella trichopoda]